MRINLLLNSNEVRAGYVNVDPFADPQDTTKTRLQLDQLDFVDRGEVQDLLALNIIDFIPSTDKDNYLNYLLSLLAIGGTITLGGINIDTVARSYANHQIDLATVNVLLYGQNPTKSGLINLTQLENVLAGKGLRILEKKQVGFEYFVKAERAQ